MRGFHFDIIHLPVFTHEREIMGFQVSADRFSTMVHFCEEPEYTTTYGCAGGFIDTFLDSMRNPAKSYQLEILGSKRDNGNMWYVI